MIYVSETFDEFSIMIDTLMSLRDYVEFKTNRAYIINEKTREKINSPGISIGAPYDITPLHIRRERSLDRLYEWETKIPRDDNKTPKPPQQQVIIKKN